jgi:hypothetical protein
MTMPNGLLIIWTDIAEDAEADFNDWYNNQHLAERVGVPGFLNGRRYIAIDGSAKYLAWYETETPEVLGSPAYGKRQANPTPWTERIMPSFRNVTRVTAERLAKSGSGLAAITLTLQVRPLAGREDILAKALADAVETFNTDLSIVSAQAFRPSDADAAKGTTEANLRATQENPPTWGLVIEATTEAAATAAAMRVKSPISVAAGAAAESGLYRLLLSRGDL